MFDSSGKFLEGHLTPLTPRFRAPVQASKYRHPKKYKDVFITVSVNVLTCIKPANLLTEARSHDLCTTRKPTNDIALNHQASLG